MAAVVFPKGAAVDRTGNGGLDPVSAATAGIMGPITLALWALRHMLFKAMFAKISNISGATGGE